jgi:tRNA threonylcarbamoyl adenosine modification protein YeaZ
VLILGIDTSTSAVAVALSDGREVLARAERLDPRAHTEALAPLVQEVLGAAGVAPRDLTDVAVGTGPGPFTGLRVGLVTAVVLGHTVGVPVHGVCSLDVLAAAAAGAGATGLAGGELLVATDARRKEVYWARYAVGPVAGGPASDVSETDVSGTDEPKADVSKADESKADVSKTEVSAAGGSAAEVSATEVLAHEVVRLDGPHVARPADVPDGWRALPTAGRGPLLHPEALSHGVGPLDVDAGVLLGLAVARLAAGEPMPVEPLYLRRPDALTTAERAAR